MQTIFHADEDSNTDYTYINKHLNINNARLTRFKSIFSNKLTHYNRFHHRIEGIETNNNKFIFEFTQKKLMDLSNIFKNICLIIEDVDNIHFTDIVRLKIMNTKPNIPKVCFNYTGDDITMMLSLDKELYEKCLSYNNSLIIPVSDLLLPVNKYFFLRHESIKLTIEIELNPNIKLIKTPYIIFDAYNLSKSELTRFNAAIHQEIINDYDFIDVNIKALTPFELELKYKILISAIVVNPENKEANMKVSLDDYLFISPHDYKFVKFSSTPNLVLNKNHYLVSDHVKDAAAGHYTSNPKTLTIYSDIDMKCRIMVKFYNQKIDDFSKRRLTDSPANTMNYNHYPLTKINDNNFIEGYWTEGYYVESPIYMSGSSNKNKNENFDFEEFDGFWMKDENSKYPYPKSENESISDEFINKLKTVFEYVNDHNVIITHYMDFSQCRMCGVYNGRKEYRITKDNISFIVPDGIIHYYETHNIHPSKEFYDFIMDF